MPKWKRKCKIQNRAGGLKKTFDIFVDILDDAGEGGHVLLCERHAQIVANEIISGLQHGGGDEVQYA